MTNNFHSAQFLTRASAARKLSIFATVDGDNVAAAKFKAISKQYIRSAATQRVRRAS